MMFLCIKRLFKSPSESQSQKIHPKDVDFSKPIDLSKIDYSYYITGPR